MGWLIILYLAPKAQAYKGKQVDTLAALVGFRCQMVVSVADNPEIMTHGTSMKRILALKIPL